MNTGSKVPGLQGLTVALRRKVGAGGVVELIVVSVRESLNLDRSLLVNTHHPTAPCRREVKAGVPIRGCGFTDRAARPIGGRRFLLGRNTVSPRDWREGVACSRQVLPLKGGAQQGPTPGL